MWPAQNCVVYAGGAADRAVIREHELYHAESGRTPKFNVLLASYETVLKDKALFRSIQWETVIVDEAHRMKNAAAVRGTLRMLPRPQLFERTHRERHDFG